MDQNSLKRIYTFYFMQKLVLLFLFFILYNASYSQVIKGKVIDKETGSTISFALIYFNGTFVGTQSDLNGDFNLDISKNTSMPLTISGIGYYSVTLSSFSAANPLIVYLAPKVYEMQEVVISSKSLVRKRKANLKLFKNEFLGITENGRNCDILNENDITFNYNTDQDTLKAFASKPILINNKSLGYSIIFNLDKFEYDKKSRSFFYKGNMFFNKDLAIGSLHKDEYNKRRKHAFEGSKMHFFRSLWSDELEFVGFTVKNSNNYYVDYNDIVITDKIHRDSINSFTKFLKYTDFLRIYYLKSSTITFIKENVGFNEDGYFDKLGLKWEGEMATHRIGDQLPYEYIPLSKMNIHE